MGIPFPEKYGGAGGVPWDDGLRLGRMVDGEHEQGRIGETLGTGVRG